jgi:hypothetical protein
MRDARELIAQPRIRSEITDLRERDPAALGIVERRPRSSRANAARYRCRPELTAARRDAAKVSQLIREAAIA